MVERTDRRLRVDRQESPRVPKEGLEATGIEFRCLGSQDVARPAPLHPLGSESLAQVRGVTLEGVPNGLRGLLTPYFVDQDVGRYEMVGSKEQVGKHCPLLRPPESDRRLLLTIIDKFDGGPVGLSSLSAALSEEADAIEDIYEPYLIQIGFLERTPRGRLATARAYEYFGRAVPGRGLF